MEIDPLLGVMPYQAREIAFGLGLSAVDKLSSSLKIMMQMGPNVC